MFLTHQQVGWNTSLYPTGLQGSVLLSFLFCSSNWIMSIDLPSSSLIHSCTSSNLMPSPSHKFFFSSYYIFQLQKKFFFNNLYLFICMLYLEIHHSILSFSSLDMGHAFSALPNGWQLLVFTSSCQERQGQPEVRNWGLFRSFLEENLVDSQEYVAAFQSPSRTFHSFHFLLVYFDQLILGPNQQTISGSFD